ncbi:MAG: hypothetical protein Q4D81_10200 [Eubacteriales bacterium]|nr:hypothetical protein [Eubacteriales bacterium]
MLYDGGPGCRIVAPGKDGLIFMDRNFSILFFIFAAAILLYAILMAVTKDYNMLPYRATQSVKPKNPEQYMVQLSKVVALVGVAIGIGAVVSLWNTAAGVAVMIVGTAAALWCGTKIVKN